MNEDETEYSATEEQIQMAFVDWVRVKHPEIAKHIVRIANDGKRSYYEGKKQQKLGMCKGASDLFIAWPQRQKMANGTYGSWVDKCGLWLEVKCKKGQVSEDQKEFQQRMINVRYEAKTVWSVEEAIKAFEAYI
jgi:hypothetical protein